MLKEFKTFIARGNVIDMAVGIIVGAAFTSIVKSLVNNLINPLIGLFIGRIDLSNLVLTVGDAQFKYGSFLNAVINFLIISFVVFLMVKAINVNTDLKLSEITGLKMYFFTGLNAVLYVVPCNLSCDMIYQKF